MTPTTILDQPELDNTSTIADEFDLDIRIVIMDTPAIDPILSGSDCSICTSCYTEQGCDACSIYNTNEFWTCSCQCV